jgi:tetratricopeptide (TPR) repeat protein
MPKAPSRIFAPIFVSLYRKWVHYFSFLTLFLLNQVSGFSQASLVHQDPFQAYYDARQWMAEGNYALSYPVFVELERKMRNGTLQEHRLLYDEVLFHTIVCELMQENEAAKRNAQAYLSSNRSEIHRSLMGFYLGQYYFKRQDFGSALSAFENVQAETLSERQKSEMQFAYGYSLLTQRKFKEAKPLLAEARLQIQSPYHKDANYYYGLLAYNDGQYKEAIRSFEIAEDAPKYQTLAPYYRASIQYALGNKDTGLELAEEALRKGNQFYENELHQLVGHAYFEKGNYAKAITHLGRYVQNTDKVKREDFYELAYSYYQLKNYEQSIVLFRPLSDGKDSLSQHAMYLLGDAYLKTNDKANAKTAFMFCADNSSYPTIRENSMFNAGKLSYDLGLDDEAVRTLKKFITTFPNSKWLGESKEILIASLANTSNYKEALTLYEGLENKTTASQRIYPRLLFNRAQEEINDRRIDEADKLLDKASMAPYNESVLPLLKFWKGEIAYFRKDYAGAIKYMSEYLKQPVENRETNTTNARYTLAYSYLLNNEFGNAEREFETLQRGRLSNPQQADDVKARLADAYFMQKSFSKAKPLYTELQERKSDYADYALYQLGMIAGAENKPAQKISYLQNVDKQYPESILAASANLEVAKTYLADENYREALPWLEKVMSAKGGDALKPEAMLKQGLAYYNLNNSGEALKRFRALITTYRDSPEADEAIDNVRSIFVEQGKPNEFVTFMTAVGRGLDRNTADSLSFVAAEIQLSEGKKDEALKGFIEYLRTYPEGRYNLQAIWFSAEIYRGKKDLKNAIPLYESLIAKTPNRHAEASLLQVSRYYYFEEKNYAKAVGFYKSLLATASNQENKLEAMRGIVRCMYYSGAYEDALTVANELLEQRGIGTDDKVFANLVLGKQTWKSGNYTAAIKHYKEVASLNNAAYGAEARFGIAESLLAQNKLDEAEEAAFDVIKKSGSYAFWVTKSYILLGDVYHKQKDYFNAKATYKSVSENASISELKKEAADKLKTVEKEEREQSKISQ